MSDPLRHHRRHAHLQSPFGNDRFGKVAEQFARFFGTPKFILIQTVMIIIWIILNASAILFSFDPYPFILLNLFFSTQAAYAAPLILLAQTRQADRDKAHEEAEAKHREDVAVEQKELAKAHRDLLVANTVLTQQVHDLTREVHDLLKHSG